MTGAGGPPKDARGSILVGTIFPDRMLVREKELQLIPDGSRSLFFVDSSSVGC